MLGNIVIMFFIVVLLIYQIKIVKKWYRPFDLYMLWSIFLILISLILYPSYNWSVFGILWWLGTCFLCSLMGNFGYQNPIIISSGKRVISKPKKRINYKVILVLFFICAFLYSYRLLSLHGFSIFSIRSMSDLYSINNYLQGYRYGNFDEHEDVLQQVFLCFTYALPLCGGVLLAYNKFRRIMIKVLCFLTVFPNFAISFLNNTKTGIIFACILFFVGYIIGNLLFYKENLKLTKKFLRKIVFVGLLFLILVFAIIRLRYNSDPGKQNFSYIISILKDYIFGCVINFDYFFMEFGTIDLSLSHSYLDNSNILTANAFFINQYGYILPFFIWGGIGYISGCAYRNLECGNKGILDVLILVFSYMNCIYFFTYIPYRYLTLVIGTFILFPVFFSLFRRETVNFKSKLFCYRGDFL